MTSLVDPEEKSQIAFKDQRVAPVLWMVGYIIVVDIVLYWLTHSRTDPLFFFFRDVVIIVCMSCALILLIFLARRLLVLKNSYRYSVLARILVVCVILLWSFVVLATMRGWYNLVVEL